MTPLGHLATGFVLGHLRARSRSWAPTVVAIGAVLPDLDFVLIGSPDFNAWHRVITHNLLFVAATSLALAWPLSRWTGARAMAVAVALAIGGLSHLAIDACIDANASNGIGIAALWPFDDRMVSPMNLVDAGGNPHGWDDPRAALLGVARGLVWELPWIAVAGWLVVRARRSRPAPGG